MMTREEAKTKVCYYRTIQDMHDYAQQLILADCGADILTALISSNKKITDENKQKVSSYMVCKSELCPSWRDTKHDELWCRHNIQLGMIDDTLCPNKFKYLSGVGQKYEQIVNPFICNSCHERYGYCGG